MDIQVVRKDSRKIVQFLFDEASKAGNLYNEFNLQDADIAALGFEDQGYFNFCLQYLAAKDLVHQDLDLVQLGANAVAFLEEA